jgi:hypothetical protein
LNGAALAPPAGAAAVSRAVVAAEAAAAPGEQREGLGTARDSNPNRQIRRLVLYVHAVRLSAVYAAQVRGRIQPDRRSPVWYWLVDCHRD